MSEELSKLPPQVQQRLMRLQQLQQSLQGVMAVSYTHLTLPTKRIV